MSGIADGDFSSIIKSGIKWLFTWGLIDFIISLITAWILSDKSTMGFWILLFIILGAIWIATFIKFIKTLWTGKLQL
jgi:hypothetical protein